MPSSTFRMLLPWAWREDDRIRREGSACLVDAALAAGTSRFQQESFAPAYADVGHRWIDESWPLRPAPYNRTLLDAEGSAARFAAGGGAGMVLRFGGLYGPDPFLRDMIAVVRRGWGPLPGPAGAYWSSVSHDDAASAVVAALAVPGGTYDVTGLPRPRPMPGWLTALGGKTMELLSRSQRVTNAKLKAASRWAPRWPSAREGLREAVWTLERNARGGATRRPAGRSH